MKPLPIPAKNPNPCLGSGYSRVGVRVTPERPRGYPCPSLVVMFEITVVLNIGFIFSIHFGLLLIFKVVPEKENIK